jgi:DNA-binding Xre family transcriptional regulator
LKLGLLKYVHIANINFLYSIEYTLKSPLEIPLGVKENDLIIAAFAKVLKSQRNSLLLTQLEVSEKANLERSFLAVLESGKKQATVTTIFKLCKALNLKPSELMTMVEKEIEGE